MAQHEGECVGGPMHGQRLIHWAKEKELLSPVDRFSLNDSEPVEAVVIGRYKLNDYGQWHWHATPEGKALHTLQQD